MDTVILAAGKGSRLAGIAAPFHKPLMVVNGRPLIRNAVIEAQKAFGGKSKVIIVAAPENALPIAQLLADLEVRIVLQVKPEGPGDALRVGLEMVDTERVLVLMGDNTVTADDIERVCATHIGAQVGVQRLAADEAERFTYYQPLAQRWFEKTPIPPGSGDLVYCWIGPVAFPVDELWQAIWQNTKRNGEYPIGPMLNDITPQDFIEVSCEDIGIPEAFA